MFEDTFTRMGPVVGSTADTGQLWTGPGAFMTNGSQLVVNSNNSPRVGVSFNPNTKYELSLDITVDSGHYIGFGFSDTTSSNPWVASTGTMAVRSTSAEIVKANSGFPFDSLGFVSPVFPKTLAIELETGATLANSTLRYKVDGAYVGGTDSADLSSANGIFIQAHNSGMGPVDNFRLTAVPEPGSWMYLGLMSLAVIGRRKYRHLLRFDMFTKES